MKLLTAEEKTAYYYFHVLNNIREKLDPSDKNDESVEYHLTVYPSLNDPCRPNPTQEQILIDYLIKDKVLEKVKKNGSFQTGTDENGNPKSAGVIYYFKPINPAFNNLCTKYNRIIKGYQEGNLFTFSISKGTMFYISPTGEEYRGRLNTSSNSYRLIYFLTKNPFKVFDFDNLAKNLRDKRQGANSSNERRVRDTVAVIKNKLKYDGEELFVSNYGFGLKCDVKLIY